MVSTAYEISHAIAFTGGCERIVPFPFDPVGRGGVGASFSGVVHVECNTEEIVKA